MQETGEDFGEQDEDTEIQNLPLYTERKADGIYRYRLRVPKNLVECVHCFLRTPFRNFWASVAYTEKTKVVLRLNDE